MQTTYKIHPGIAISRLGNSKEFYLNPDEVGGLPIEWDPANKTAKVDDKGNPVNVTQFKDSSGKVKREAAKFSIFVHDDPDKPGRPLVPGETIQGIGSKGPLVDIEWTVWLANKKASWYQFQELQGEHGYQQSHALRNEHITDNQARQDLIINPGPQTVYNSQNPTSAQFARGKNPDQTQNFPPPIQPNSIDTLGEVMTFEDMNLYVLGAFGNSGQMVEEGEQPTTVNFANNPGWFDDIADGPVSAKLIYRDDVDKQYRFIQAGDPSWVIVGYPAYVPQMVNMITIDEVVYDLSVKNFAYDTYLYGTGSFEGKPKVTTAELPAWQAARKGWNPGYLSFFYRDIWPILQRPGNMQWVTTVLGQSLNPHNTTEPRGDFYEKQISQPPDERTGDDPYREKRMYIYNALRKPGQENQAVLRKDQQLFYSTDPAIGGDMGNEDVPNQDPYSRLYGAPLMPLLCGDNPVTNDSPSKFLKLTDTQLFLLRQWAIGKFINEKEEDLPQDPEDSSAKTPREIDRIALSNGLGGSFCPGGEVCWIIRNPVIYSEPYRFNANQDYYPNTQNTNVGTTPGIGMYNQLPLSLNNNPADGLEPGDITKYSALPWQADFNECSDQPIDVAYEDFVVTNPDNVPASKQANILTLWWPSHRPMQVQVPIPYGATGSDIKEAQFLNWTRGIEQSNAGDLKMVTAWSELGFLRNRGSTEGGWLEQERKHPDLPVAQKYILPPPKKQ